MFKLKLPKKNIENLISLGAFTALSYSLYSGFFPSLPKGSTPVTPEMEAEINARAQKMGLTKPIKIYTTKDENDGECKGVNLPGLNTLQLMLGKDRQNQPFVISHELAHAKHNDKLMTLIIAIIGVMGSPFMGKRTYHHFCFSIGVLASCLAYVRQAEKKADLTAAKHCKNIEIAAFINELHNVRDNALTNRNRSSPRLFDNIKKKIFITSTGDNTFDLHPSHTARIEYLTQIINQRQDDDPNIEVYYQTNENAPFIKVTLTDEQSALLREIIHTSPKNNIYRTLTNIVLLAGDIKGNVQLYQCGECNPQPFDFEPGDIKDLQLLPAILKTIMFAPKRTHAIANLQDDAITELYENKDLKEQLNMLPDQKLNILKVINSPVAKIDESKSLYHLYPASQPLNLKESNLCFEAPVTTNGIRL